MFFAGGDIALGPKLLLMQLNQVVELLKEFMHIFLIKNSLKLTRKIEFTDLNEYGRTSEYVDEEREEEENCMLNHLKILNLTQL